MVVVALLVGFGFAVVVVGNDETFGIFGISLLRAQVMPLHEEVIQGKRKCDYTFTSYKVRILDIGTTIHRLLNISSR